MSLSLPLLFLICASPAESGHYPIPPTPIAYAGSGYAAVYQPIVAVPAVVHVPTVVYQPRIVYQPYVVQPVYAAPVYVTPVYAAPVYPARMLTTPVYFSRLHRYRPLRKVEIEYEWDDDGLEIEYDFDD